MDYLLPATTYNAPSRLGRGRPLKTIIEAEEMSFGFKSDSEGDDSDATIKPSGLDSRLAHMHAKSKLSSSLDVTAPSPVESSPCSSNGEGLGYQRHSSRSSCCDSDAGTVFSEDSCPSLASGSDTTFFTNSSRNSVASVSSQKSRNQYPTIMIPTDSWNNLEEPIKEAIMAFAPEPKVLLSPQNLSALPRDVPSINNPPSLVSASPSLPTTNSAPITPDLRNLAATGSQAWGSSTRDSLSNASLEITTDDDHSILLSPAEPLSARPQSIVDRHSVNYASDYSTDWSDMVVHFPQIPGATPIENTPIEPDVYGFKNFGCSPTTVSGVQLPTDAITLLQNLTRSYSPELSSPKSVVSRKLHEMQECNNVTSLFARSGDAQTPALSDYSFSQLSIPSPGGFFNSLQANSRSTWTMAKSRRSSAPSSAIAENFYGLPWQPSISIKETTVNVPDTIATDGPPTARQSEFAIPPEHVYDDQVEDDDMYGAARPALNLEVPKRSPGFEYEETYETELKQAAEKNIDRTSNWLSAQTSYLSALRETNPLNDPADYAIANAYAEDEEEDQNQYGVNSPAAKAVRFLEQASKAATPVEEVFKSPRSPRAGDPIFLDAYRHCKLSKTRTDTFLQASTRLDRVNTDRIALPAKHIQQLLNVHTAKTIEEHARPKYRGPFSQNTKQSGTQKTPEQTLFVEAERRQAAASHISSTAWTQEAQRKVLHQGRLFSSAATERMLTRKSVAARDGKSKSKPRILDLGGPATGSWAWAAAERWTNAKIVTVEQETRSGSGPAVEDIPLSLKPQNPSNHTAITVPELWRLPFGDNYFDAISARTLHAYLRHKSHSGSDSVDEWDLTLRECYRVLRPGGCLDFVLLDSTIATNTSTQLPLLNTRLPHQHHQATASISPTAAIGQGLASPDAGPAFSHTFHTNSTVHEFQRDLKRLNYDVAGGTSTLLSRLSNVGFTSTRRQWVGLPIGRTGATHHDPHRSYLEFARQNAPLKPDTASITSKTTTGTLQRRASIRNADGRSRTPFPPAPRPLSEVSTISGIIGQYSNVEAVQGAVGSTTDVADMTGLVGTTMWEAWLVRTRLEMMRANAKNDESIDISNNTVAAQLLHGVTSTLATAYSQGGYFKLLVGFTRKASNKPSKPKIARKPQPQQPQISVAIPAKIDQSVSQPQQQKQQHPQGWTPVQMKTPQDQVLQQTYYAKGFGSPDQPGLPLRLDTRASPRSINTSPQMYTLSAVERGEVGTIPMMIFQ